MSDKNNIPNENAECSGSCDTCKGCDSRALSPGSTITITTDDNREITCAILTMFKLKDTDYVALMEVDKRGLSVSNDVMLYRFNNNSPGAHTLENIEDPLEYESVSRFFSSLIEAANKERSAQK